MKPARPSHADLVPIVLAARTLDERLGSAPPPAGRLAAEGERLARARLDRWCRHVARGDAERLGRRLAWDGLDLAAARRALGDPGGDPGAADLPRWPRWARTLAAIVTAARRAPLPSPRRDPAGAAEPFAAVVSPMLAVARRRLARRLAAAGRPSPLALLSAAARQALERALGERLSDLSARALDAELAADRPPVRHALLLLLGELPDAPGRERLDALVGGLLADGLLGFFRRWPVLGRLVATAVDDWVDATAELVERLAADRPELERAFGALGGPAAAGAPRQVVERIEASLSDPHHGGRSVVSLTFASGLRVVYKPKDLGLERAYNELLRWLDRRVAAPRFGALRVLPRAGYGWVEHVPQRPCASAAEARRFYRGAGRLLCLLYVLGGDDCHYENLIACGERLALVDAETLLQAEERQPPDPRLDPLLDSLADAALDDGAGRQLRESVVRTGLLPRWQFSGDGRVAYDVSALGGVGVQRAPRRALRWRSAGTDDLHLAREETVIPAHANAPSLAGEALSPNDYAAEIDAGFTELYRLLAEEREALLARGGPLAAFRDQPVRFVFRATKAYALLLERALAPECLRDGAERGIELDAVCRTFLERPEPPPAWPVVRAELRALERLDIPYFGTGAASDALSIGVDEPIARYFQASGYDEMAARLRRLDTADLARQRTIVQGAFAARAARPHGGGGPASAGPLRRDPDGSAALPRAALLAEAAALAREIGARATISADGAASWIGLGLVPAAERLQLQVLDHDLHSGNGGIALFLAALDRAAGTSEHRDLAIGAFARLRRSLVGSRPEALRRLARRYGLSGTTGLGSVLYALVATARLLDAADLLDDAARVAALVTPELVAADRQLDVMGGAAGAILGLLALHRATGDPAARETAARCGRHLLAHRADPPVMEAGAPRAWRTIAPRPLAGFSHGAAGIAYALLRLYAVTGDERFRRAAREGMAYERRLFSPARGNWPDLRVFADQGGEPGFRLGWCHGASGIGLARLGAAPLLEPGEVDDEVDAALAAVAGADRLELVDPLCCGNLGAVELLLVAAERLSRPALRQAAERRAARVVRRAAAAGSYRYFASLDGAVFAAGFFQGAAGIGYTLLRAGGAALPSVLLWE